HAPEKRTTLRRIRRHERDEWQQLATQHVDSFVAEQLRATRRTDHGIEHDERRRVPAQRIRDSANGGRRREHPDLHRAHVGVGEYGLALLSHEPRGYGFDSRDAAAVLPRQRYGNSATFDAERLERFEVGLYSRTAARIGSGDAQHHGRRQTGTSG